MYIYYIQSESKSSEISNPDNEIPMLSCDTLHLHVEMVSDPDDIKLFNRYVPPFRTNCNDYTMDIYCKLNFWSSLKK